MGKRKTFWRQLLMLLAIIGPGIVTGSVDNDVGGITTYSVAGAKYGFHMLWALIPCGIVLFVVQEMNARMGLVTQKGLADLIRENAGVKVTFFMGTSLHPAPTGGQAKEARWIDIHEDDLDEAQLATWIRQAAAIPGWGQS